ncbi:hypothetical protein OTU49_000404, partial [Cherax quadricarinatus]
TVSLPGGVRTVSLPGGVRTVSLPGGVRTVSLPGGVSLMSLKCFTSNNVLSLSVIFQTKIIFLSLSMIFQTKISNFLCLTTFNLKFHGTGIRLLCFSNPGRIDHMALASFCCVFVLDKEIR